MSGDPLKVKAPLSASPSGSHANMRTLLLPGEMHGSDLLSIQLDHLPPCRPPLPSAAQTVLSNVQLSVNHCPPQPRLSASSLSSRRINYLFSDEF